MSNNDVPIWEKYTLTIEEASKYLIPLTQYSEKGPCACYNKL